MEGHAVFSEIQHPLFQCPQTQGITCQFGPGIWRLPLKAPQHLHALCC